MPSSDDPTLTSRPTPPVSLGPDGTRVAGLPQLTLLIGAICLPVLGSTVIAPVLPQMAQEFDGTPSVGFLVPVALTAPSLVIGLTAPFVGLLADKVGRKRVLLVAMAFYAVAGTAPAYLGTLPSIVASRLVLGLCEAAILSCSITLIADYWSGAERARYMALQTMVASLAATVFLAIGGVLGGFGWRSPFWLYIVALPLAIPMVKLIWQPAEDAVDGPPHRNVEPVPWRFLLIPCSITLFFGVVFFALIVELPFVLAGVGVTSSTTIGLISAVMALATALGCLTFARLARYTPRKLIPIEFAVTAVGLVLVFATPSVPLIISGAVITGFGGGLLQPTLLTWTVNPLSFEQRGRGTGLWTGFGLIGQFLSPIILGAVGSAIGGLQPALGVLGVAAAVMAVVSVLATSRNNRPLTETDRMADSR
jgi:MFS family permease